MKIICCYCIILFSLSSVNSHAQPGYLGKKTTLAFQFECTPYYPRPGSNFLGNFFTQKDFLWLAGYHFKYARVISRKHELIGGAGVRFRNYKAQYFTGSGSPTGYIAQVEKSLDVNEYFFDMGVRRFFNDNIAPFGWYQQFKVGWVTARYRDDANYISIKYIPSGSSTLQVPITTRDLSLFRLSYGLGLKTMLSKSLFFLTEFDLNLPLKPTKLKETEIKRSKINASNYQDINFYENFNLFHGHNLYFGIGILF